MRHSQPVRRRSDKMRAACARSRSQAAARSDGCGVPCTVNDTCLCENTLLDGRGVREAGNLDCTKVLLVDGSLPIGGVVPLSHNRSSVDMAHIGLTSTFCRIPAFHALGIPVGLFDVLGISGSLRRPVSSLFPATEVVGRIDQLVEAVHERFKDRYFEGERKHRFPLPVLPCFSPT